VLAAAGLKDLLARLPGRATRSAAFSALAAVAIADLAMVGFPKAPVPEMPGCYAFLKERDPKATLLEVPFQAGGYSLNALCTYWQTRHRLTTSAGYSGFHNSHQEDLIGYNSPFRYERFESPDYLEDPGKFPIELASAVDFQDYLWLYLTANRFDYLILHLRNTPFPADSANLQRLRTLLAGSKVFEDKATVVYARSKLRLPTRPIQLTREGWTGLNVWKGVRNDLLARTGRIAVYNPDSSQDLNLALNTAGVRRARTVRVRVRAGSAELARWDVGPDVYQLVISPPFRLPAGLHDLTIESEPVAYPHEDRDSIAKSEKRPNHLRVAGLKLIPRSDLARREPPERPSTSTETR
jgi:hypothetical protein